MKLKENLDSQVQSNIELAELNAILSSIPDAVYIGDSSGIKRSNQLALDMLGFESVEELNQNIGILSEKINTRDLKTGKKLLVEEEPFIRALSGETLVKEVVTTHIKTNKEIIVRCAAAPVIMNGEVIAAIAINSDITDNVRNKELTRKSNEELKRKNEALDRFVYITSHDLKAPLNSIGPLLEMLKNDFEKPLGAEGGQIVDMAITKVNEMNMLIHGLLSIARSEEKIKEPIDMLQLVSNIVRNANIPKSINVYINQNLPLVKYHKISLVQVFQNIFSNSVKFMDKEKGIIKVDCEEDRNFYIITISDNGPGINKNDQEKVFNKFFIGHNDSSKDSSGLGLSIVRDIIEENNGKIWIESTQGEGVTFYFTIPKI